MNYQNQINRKGIILAGGKGSRLSPITNVVSKQLLPIFDKPMIYYPLSTLMLSGIKEILIITNEKDKTLFQSLLGDGEKLGISIEYKTQKKPDGIAQAFLIADEFIKDKPVTLILGDNIFYGKGLVNLLQNANNNSNATIFAYPVKDPERYGVVEFNKDLKVLSIEEKPKLPKSNFAVTGIYYYDNTVLEKAKSIKFSKRGELEISDINNLYLKENSLNIELFGRGMAWLDTGTFDSLNEASIFIKTLENRQGLKISCPEEIAWRKGWIDDGDLIRLSKPLEKSGYGKYLISLLEE
tara:strand:- start:12914 stop:13801 length:888 start_codon:yes stop_codon:yes gene_type:complete